MFDFFIQPENFYQKNNTNSPEIRVWLAVLLSKGKAEGYESGLQRFFSRKTKGPDRHEYLKGIEKIPNRSWTCVFNSFIVSVLINYA